MLRLSRFTNHPMRILQQTHNRLVLRHYPVRSWVTSGGLALLGLVLIAFSAGQPIATTLSCKRLQSDFVLCQLQRSTWIGIRTQQPILDVKSVRLAERRVKGGTQFYLVLTTEAEEVEISNSEHQVSSIAEIQAFLSNAQAPTLTLHYHQSTLVIVLLMVAVGYLGAALYLLTTPAVTCTFYQLLHKVVIEQQRWGRTNVLEHPLNAIYHVEVEEVRRKNGKEYRMVLWLRGTGQLPLTKDYSTTFKPIATIAQSVRQFLQLPQ
jgi:hypothetical protein